MLVNYRNIVIEASFEHARRWVGLGVFIEHSLCMYDERPSFHNWELAPWWSGFRCPERSILGSVPGQMNNPLPTDSFRMIVGRLFERGVPEDQIRSMVARNLAELLGVA